MAVAHLPERPDLDQLRNQARDLQRQIRRGIADATAEAGVAESVPDYPLTGAQRLVARRYGFASWPRLVHQVEAIRARIFEYRESDTTASLSDQFLRLACLNYASDNPARPEQAHVLLESNPMLAHTDLAVAAVAGHVESVRELLLRSDSDPDAPTGPYGWTALMYLTYGRVPGDGGDSIGAARLLLDAGADPNDGRFFDGLPIPFTVLTGVFGGGERGQSPHASAAELAHLLLSRGADPNDAQTLYNRMFTPADDFLEVLFAFGLGSGDGGAWHRALPDLLEAPKQMVRGLLEWAVTHDQRDRVSLLARNGVDITSPLRTGRTPIETAVGNGHAQLAARLEQLGAVMPVLDPVEQFISAALAGDAAAVRSTDEDVVAAARRSRPALIVWAAGHGRIEAVDLLVATGFDINALGRADLPVDHPWQTALHTAVEADDVPMVTRLLELGADATLRDARFDATPAQWVEHLGHGDLAPLFTE